MESVLINANRDSYWMWMVYATGVHIIRFLEMVDASVWRAMKGSMVDVF